MNTEIDVDLLYYGFIFSFRLMDHRPAFDFTETVAENLKIRIHSNEFIIGNINVGDIPEVAVNNNSYTNEEKQYVKKRNQNSQYEFIIHKIVQYNIRKYPDEIVSKNVVIHGLFSYIYK
jgi:hypothetical protein